MKTSFQILLLAVILWANPTYAEVSKNSELYKTMQTLDEHLFETGFNQCDLKTLEKFIHSDLDFYHDVGGKQDKHAFMRAMKDNICSSPDRKPIRKLVAGSMQVYQLLNNGELYGAIQKGVHEFYIKEPNKTLYITGIAKFTSVWVKENDQWKLIEALSYEHRPGKAQ